MEVKQLNEQTGANSADKPGNGIEIAGVGARSYGFILDWHIRLLAALLWIYLAAFLFYDFSVFASLFDEDSTSAVAARVIFMPAAIIYFLYHPVLELLMRGSTPGKRMAGARLLTQEGATPGVIAILLRNVLRLIDALPGVYTVGLLVAIFTRKHVRIGDIAAGTVLVYEKQVSSQSPAELTQQPLDSSLSAEQYALLLELLERWQQLEKSQRLHLGQQFLRKIGDPLISDDAARLKSHLDELASGRA